MEHSADADHGHDGGWGWEALGPEDDVDGAPSSPSHVPPSASVDGNEKAPSLPKISSDKSLHSRKSSSSIPGITSSPSFQELEKAIGATLASNLSSGDMAEMSEAKSPHLSGGHLPQRHSSTNLTQQKVNQQRYRQQFHQSHRSPSYATYKHPFSPPVSAKTELGSFINEAESRALIVFHSAAVPQAAIKEACSKFGVLYYIRPEFHAKGVTFISYFDLQAAMSAKASVADALGPGSDASVHFSVMLHATNSNSEEFKLVVKNLPAGDGAEGEFESVVSRFGTLRSIQKTFSSVPDLQNAPSAKPPAAYCIEYFNIQDARLAASELSATSASLWGPDVSVKFAPLDERKQQLCQQLLTTMSRWRSEMASGNPLGAAAPVPAMHMQPAMPYSTYQHVVPPMPMPFGMVNAGYGFSGNYNPSFEYMGSLPPMMAPPQMFAQPGFNGAMQSVFYPYPQMDQYPPSIPIHQESTMHHQLHSTNPESQAEDGGYPPSRIPVPQRLPAQPRSAAEMGAPNEYRPAYPLDYQGGAHYAPTADGSLGSAPRSYPPSAGGQGNARRTKGPNNSSARDAGAPDADFSLDLVRIRDGHEGRTTVMVRNIPNKYNQQMLLDEVNVRHRGTYDFFYLPIDFKNRCNVGYCFINFLDPLFIVPFVDEFNGQRWKSFNSEKVCAVSFARIQGKGAMIARFQNSSLLDKDDEYKPLLFCSSGPDKGNPEPFPAAVRRGDVSGGGEN